MKFMTLAYVIKRRETLCLSNRLLTTTTTTTTIDCMPSIEHGWVYENNKGMHTMSENAKLKFT